MRRAGLVSRFIPQCAAQSQPGLPLGIIHRIPEVQQFIGLRVADSGRVALQVSLRAIFAGPLAAFFSQFARRNIDR